MELALHLGMPRDVMLRSMKESELQSWNRYAQRNLLPLRRLELYLAQIAHVVAVTMGGSKSKLGDWLIKQAQETPDNVVDLEAMRKAFGFNPRKKKA